VQPSSRQAKAALNAQRDTACKTRPFRKPTQLFRLSAGVGGSAALRAWKTIALDEFANSFALRNALDAADFGIGDLAEEILARPPFTSVSTKTDVDDTEETPWD